MDQLTICKEIVLRIYDIKGHTNPSNNNTAEAQMFVV
jgi:hypothetical protein